MAWCSLVRQALVLSALLAVLALGAGREEPLVVVIDPGHGWDPATGGYTGAVNRYTGDHEDEFNLAIALRLERELRQAGSAVYLTRRDRYVPPDYDGDGLRNNADRWYLPNALGEVVPRAHKPRADAYVSLHLNASPKLSRRGVTVVYSSAFRAARHREQSQALAFEIYRELTAHLKPSAEPFTVNGLYFDKLALPHAIVEAAFITNAADLAWIRRPENQQLAAEAVARAVLRWWRQRAAAEPD